MIIGGYNKGWNKLFKPLKEKLKVFKEILLTTDGDDCILKGIKGIKVILQRCLFHIPHQANYTLWQDKIQRKTKPWVHILTKLIDICNVRKIKEDESIAEETIKIKKKELKELIDFCKDNKATKTAEYLENKPCEAYDAPFDVRLPLTKEGSDFEIDTVVQPDIVVICNKSKLGDAGCTGAPDIVIEIISESTASKDLKIKFNLYEKSGVKEYWIVFPDEKVIQIFKLKNGEYGKPEVYGTDDKITAGLFPDLVLDCNEIFG